MRAGPYSEFGQPDLAGAVRGHVGQPDLVGAVSLVGLTSFVLYWGHVGQPDLSGAIWGHVPLSVPDVTKQSGCIMERLSRFFVKENCMS